MTAVTTKIADGIAWVVIDNPPVNATSLEVRQGLAKAVIEVQGQRLAILHCLGRTFVAGGDMSEFDKPAQAPHLPDIVDAIEQSETPFLAWMHGNVLGGGLEIAMACAFRFAAPGTRFGLPEVNVGLIPGAGGTQRAPRLFGWEAAIDMACSGRLLTASEAKALGAIDGIESEPEAALRVVAGERPFLVSSREVAPLDGAWLADREAAIAKRAKGQTAPLDNLKALLWAKLPYGEGQPKERAKHLELRQSDQSKALRHAFFAERQVVKPAKIEGVAAAELSRIAIVGGGLMGAGIAASCLSAGFEVTLIERDDEAANAAGARVTALIEAAFKRGKIDAAGFERQISSLVGSADYEAATEADLVIEAVFEELALKQSIFRELAKIVGAKTLLASNTSYLDPRAIFDGVPHQGRCIGMHFFAPAHLMRLLEVVFAPGTSVETIATAFGFAKRLRKIPVLSGICDGFIGNRMLMAYRRAAEYMLADGALPGEIDAAMRAFGMAMGPFEAQDMSGLQIAEANRRRQDATRDPAERYVGISDRLCAAGRYGQRSGAGWYVYEEGQKKPLPDPAVTAIIEAYAADQSISRRSFTQDEIQKRLLAVLANEGARIIEEGIAETDAAVDMVQLHGYGFPRWRGGPMHMASVMGDTAIAAILEGLEADSPGSWLRAERFESQAA